MDRGNGCVQIPAGGLPRTVEVVLREAYVERIRPGDFMVFTGTLIGVPDVSVIATPGERVTRGIRSAWIEFSKAV